MCGFELVHHKDASSFQNGESFLTASTEEAGPKRDSEFIRRNYQGADANLPGKGNTCEQFIPHKLDKVTRLCFP